MTRKTMTRHGTTRGDTPQIWVRWEFGKMMRTLLESKVLRVMTMTKTKGTGWCWKLGREGAKKETVQQMQRL